jgi:ABC-type amino acid transport substrate-binding protein
VTHIEGADRSQVSLLPACVEDDAGPNGLVRVVDAFVASLDLREIGVARSVATTGRPGCHDAAPLCLEVSQSGPGLTTAFPLFATGLRDPRAARTAPVLRVGAALPDPPFAFMTKDGPAGFDIALMKRIAEILGRKWQLVPYECADFNGIFAGLNDGSYDCIASGTTITPGRRKIADFCAPYAVSGQSLVVDAGCHPNVHGIADLKGLVIGVQQGNTSQPVADNCSPGIAPRRYGSMPMTKSRRHSMI